MDKEINTVSEEQVLHNKLSFEINQELIHLMKRIVELQQQNQKYKEVIDKAIEYINHFSKESEVKIYGLPKCKVFIGDIEQLLDILKEVSE